MKTATEAPTNATTCPHCNGRGEIGVWVDWSDGMGGSSAACSVCDGTGKADFHAVARELAEIKTRLQSFLYKTWLIAGCRTQDVRSTEDRVWAAPSQALCNEVLRGLKEFPAALHDGCDITPHGRDKRRMA